MIPKAQCAISTTSNLSRSVQALRALATAHAAGLSRAGDLRPEHVLVSAGGGTCLAGMRCVWPAGTQGGTHPRDDRHALPEGLETTEPESHANEPPSHQSGCALGSDSGVRGGKEACPGDPVGSTGDGRDADPTCRGSSSACERAVSEGRTPMGLDLQRGREGGQPSPSPSPWPCRTPGGPCLEELTGAWRAWRLSTYDYLLHLNRLAGRRWGDPSFHPIMPWILDMSQPPEPAMHTPPQARALPMPGMIRAGVASCPPTCFYMIVPYWVLDMRQPPKPGMHVPGHSVPPALASYFRHC